MGGLNQIPISGTVTKAHYLGTTILPIRDDDKRAFEYPVIFQIYVLFPDVAMMCETYDTIAALFHLRGPPL